MNEITSDLDALTTRDFDFAHPRDASGALVAVVGLRVLHEVIDVVQLFSENDAEAVRVPNDEPDILFPQRVVWRTTGTTQQVIADLVELDEPSRHRHVQPTGYWPPAPSHTASTASRLPVSA